MFCFDSQLAYYMTFDFWNKRADIIVAVVAVIALGFTIFQIIINKKETRRVAAFSAYNEYLKMCIEYTDFAYGDENKIKNNGAIDPKYPWFISKMLFSFEQVLSIEKRNQEWIKAIEAQLTKHLWYLRNSKSVLRGDWSKVMQKMFDKLLV